MLKKINLVGVIAGVLIIALSVAVFLINVEISVPNIDNDMSNMKTIAKNSISAPAYESDKYYGGDAYTGMQQAAAQAANNLIPVFKAIEENSNILITENSNLLTLNNNIILANKNNAEIAKADANNTQLLISVTQNGLGVILLSLGLAVIAKNVEFEWQLRKKELQTEEVSV